MSLCLTYSASGKFDWKYIVALLFGGVVASGIWWYLPREPASMSFTYGLSDVVTAHGPEAERFEIRWRGNTVRNAVLVLVRFENNGGRPLRRSDFDSPLALTLPQATTLVDKGLDSASRQDLRPRVLAADNRVTLDPATFEVGDWVVVRLLIANCRAEGSRPPVKLSGHIAGVKQYLLRPGPPQGPPAPRSSKWSVAWGLTSWALALVAMLVLADALRTSKRLREHLRKANSTLAEVQCHTARSEALDDEFESAIQRLKQFTAEAGSVPERRRPESHDAGEQQAQ